MIKQDELIISDTLIANMMRRYGVCNRSPDLGIIKAIVADADTDIAAAGI